MVIHSEYVYVIAGLILVCGLGMSWATYQFFRSKRDAVEFRLTKQLDDYMHDHINTQCNVVMSEFVLLAVAAKDRIISVDQARKLVTDVYVRVVGTTPHNMRRLLKGRISDGQIRLFCTYATYYALNEHRIIVHKPPVA